jgi:hypothetical protein
MAWQGSRYHANEKGRSFDRFHDRVIQGHLSESVVE